MSSGPLDARELQQRVHQGLATFLSDQATHLQSVSPELAPVSEALRTFLLDGGKRLRPAFCYWGYRGAGGEDNDHVVLAASALELLHACALIHDDVMDDSDTRRGQPAIHRRFAELHRDGGWRGDDTSFGRSAAVLLGDLCLIWADQMLNTSGMSPQAREWATSSYDEMRVELMAGQYLDLLEQAHGGGTVDSALRVATYKSAKYTVEKPLLMGAALAGELARLGPAYSAFGVPLGTAFQLRDDVLGVFGDPAEIGKPAGDDLREGKRTVLVALALEAADEAQREVVRSHLGDPDLGAEGVAALRQVLTDTRALARVEALIRELTEQAVAALREAPVTEEAREVLAQLAVAATVRRV
ncbi:MAG TPA: polyprenyl synthetase family protein [Mycobacteriales bacterium]|nr:polyprenyl synthetase family protein [Mycobacteriales bacterium]